MRLLATPLVLAGIAIAGALGPAQAQVDRPADPKAQHAAPQPRWVRVVAAEDLVGRSLTDSKGREAGRIHAIVLDLDQGAAIYALVGTGGALDFGDAFVPVPFSVMKVARDGTVRMTVEADALNKSPRLDEAQFSRLNAHDRMKEIYGRYAVPLPSGFVVPPSRKRDDHPNRYLLVRPGQTAALDDQVRAAELRGQRVESVSGDTVGEINRVMLDAGNGRIAYVVLSVGGFLGLGEEWAPLPAQALEWSQTHDAYQVSGGAVATTQLRKFRGGDVPVRVRRADLQTLYDRYGVTPYWAAG